MKVLNQKISMPLLAASLGAAIGALSGQFVWALIAATGLWALACIGQNLSAFFWRTNPAGDTTTELDGPSAMRSSLKRSSDWLQKWEQEIQCNPGYKGTPGNIWNDPKWTRDD